MRVLDRKVCDCVHDPGKVLGAYRVVIGVGRGIHEVDRVRHTVFAGELDGVQVVAECAAKGDAIFLDALDQAGK